MSEDQVVDHVTRIERMALQKVDLLPTPAKGATD